MIRRARLWLPALVLALAAVAASAGAAWACAACVGWGFSRRTLDAYLAVTVALSIMPLVIGGSLFLIYRRLARRPSPAGPRPR